MIQKHNNIFNIVSNNINADTKHVSIQPLVTIIIPVFNTAKYLNKTLQSVVTQTYSNLEIICIDDGSTDLSQQIIKTFKSKDNRIILISNDRNCGVGYSRNRAFDVMRGEYFYCLDSDDFLFPDSIELMVNTITKFQLDYLIGKSNLIIDDSSDCKLIERYNGLQKYLDITPLKELFYTVFDGKTLLSKMLKCRKNLSTNGLRIIKSSIIKENNINYPEGYVHPDLYMFIKTAILAKKIMLIDVNIYNRIIRNDSIMSSIDPIESILSRLTHIKNSTNEYTNCKTYEEKNIWAQVIKDYIGALNNSSNQIKLFDLS